MTVSSFRSDVLVFLPTYNDADGIEALVHEIQDRSPRFRVLIIDDGSRYPIDKSLLPPTCLLVRLADNFGLGVCTHVALDHATRHGYDIVVRMDADGQHPVDRLNDLIAPLEAGEADLTLGGRANQHAAQGVRAILARLMKGYLSLVSRIITRGSSPRDVNTGFIALNRKAVVALSGFDLERYPEPQIFILASRFSLRLREIQVEQNDRRSGNSTIRMSQAFQIFYRFNIFVLAELLGGRRR